MDVSLTVQDPIGARVLKEVSLSVLKTALVGGISRILASVTVLDVILIAKSEYTLGDWC